MQRFLTTSFIALALVISATGAAPVAHAQDPMGDSFPTPSAASAPDTAGNASVTNANTAAAAKTTSPLSWFSPNESMIRVMNFLMSLFAWLLGAAMIVLEIAVYYTVVNMGAYVTQLSAIGVTWTILRDIGNIMLIFGFLAIGITTILNVNWYGGGKKMLPMMLVAAVFLNFSFFITAAVIDTGNLFATQFYKQINGGTLPTGHLDFDSISTLGEQGISGKIMSKLGLTQIYGKALTEKENFLIKTGTATSIGFMSIIVFLIAAFVMFSLAFILIARFVILIFLIILAPIGFAGLAVPQLAGKAKEWWSKLFEQTITAPVLLLLLYIALRVITDDNFIIGSSGSKDWTGYTTGNLTGFASAMLSFLVAMGLLLAVVISAKSLSAFGAGAVMRFGKNAAMGSVKFAGRGALWGLNRSAGRGAHMASQGLMRTGFGQTQFGRLAATGLGKAGKGFKEAKEKSAKTHEEYRDNVAKAIEEKHTPAIADARLEKEKASAASEEVIKTATTERDTATKEAQPLIDEVKRLEEIIKSKGKFDPERIAAERDLVTAKAKAAPAEAKVKVAEDKFKMANAPLDAAIAKETKATDDLAKAKREAAVAYGESARTGLTENPLTWVMSGPGGSKAGNKIIQDTLKKMTDAEKAVDMLSKAFKKEAEAAGKSTETSGRLNQAKKDLTEKTEKETETKH